jgi:hypothetical protein
MFPQSREKAWEFTMGMGVRISKDCKQQLVGQEARELSV